MSQTSRRQAQSTASVMDILQGFQASVEKQLSSIGEKLGDIQDRMDVLESQQGVLEKEIRSTKSSNTASTLSSGQGRKRVTPTALQVNYLLIIT